MQFVPLLLLGVAVAFAVAYGLAAGRGVAALAVALLVAAIVAGMQSTNALMAVSYGLAFGFPVLIGAAALGAFSGSLFRKRRYLVAFLPFLPILYFAWHTESARQSELAEKEQVYEFVHKNPQLAALVGQPLRFHLSSSTTYADKSRGRYEFRLEAKKPLYAIVNVDRSGGHPKVTLACVTSLYMGHRDVRKDACQQDVVALDDKQWALPAPAATSASAEAIPEVPAIPKDAHVSMIGVYEPKTKKRGSHEPAPITINVAAGKAPLALVLTSYEPVQWTIVNQGRPISAVMLSGFYPSTVTGTDAKTVQLGRMYVYEERGEQYEKLRAKVAFHAPGPIRFQGGYYGSEFFVPAD
jgi:hypothetical protein